MCVYTCLCHYQYTFRKRHRLQWNVKIETSMKVIIWTQSSLYKHTYGSYITIWLSWAVVIVIAWQLDLQLPMLSVPITTAGVSSNLVRGKVHSIQHYVTGRWFSPGTTDSSTNKTDRHDVTDLLLKVGFNTINPSIHQYGSHVCRP